MGLRYHNKRFRMSSSFNAALKYHTPFCFSFVGGILVLLKQDFKMHANSYQFGKKKICFISRCNDRGRAIWIVVKAICVREKRNSTKNSD